MAGLYPTNKTVQLNGQKTLYPGVDATGKYTSGDFNNPLVPPSRLDAETLNLVIDNLNSLIESMGSDANNTNTEQLATLFSSAAIANKGIKRDSAGRAKVTAPRATDDIARKAEVDAEANTRIVQDTALSTRISGNDSDISSLSTRISSNDTDIANHNSRISSNSSRISSNDTDIASHNSRISSLQNYRSYETNTGKTWINGQPIYRRCWEGTLNQNQLIMTVPSGISVTSYMFMAQDDYNNWVAQAGSGPNTWHPEISPNGIVSIRLYGFFGGNFGRFVIEYTK